MAVNLYSQQNKPPVGEQPNSLMACRYEVAREQRPEISLFTQHVRRDVVGSVPLVETPTTVVSIESTVVEYSTVVCVMCSPVG